LHVLVIIDVNETNTYSSSGQSVENFDVPLFRAKPLLNVCWKNEDNDVEKEVENNVWLDTSAPFARLHREQIFTDEQLEVVKHEFVEDWEEYFQIPFTQSLMRLSLLKFMPYVLMIVSSLPQQIFYLIPCKIASGAYSALQDAEHQCH